MARRRLKHGGRRPGAGRKKGTPNKLTYALKAEAAQYGETALDVLVEIMTDGGMSPGIRLKAASELLDRGYGRPSVHVEQEIIDPSSIPWDELKAITEKAVEQARKKHEDFIEGRYERLGISKDFFTD